MKGNQEQIGKVTSAWYLHTHVGDGQTDDGKGFEMSLTTNMSPIVSYHGKKFVLTWNDIVLLAERAGLFTDEEEIIWGHEPFDNARFDGDTKHMLIFEVLKGDASVGSVGEKWRIYLTEEGYQKAKHEEREGYIKILEDCSVRAGHVIPKAVTV